MVKLNDDRMTYVNMNKFYDIALGKYIFLFVYLRLYKCNSYINVWMYKSGIGERGRQEKIDKETYKKKDEQT
jgi:hypothetical protein